jgi:hypothetical protein
MKPVSNATIALALSSLLAFAPTVCSAAEASESGAGSIAVFVASDPAAPTSFKSLGGIYEQVCRKPGQAPLTEADVLAPLRARARARGADAIIKVRFDDSPRAGRVPCWQRMAVSGTAVNASLHSTAN